MTPFECGHRNYQILPHTEPLPDPYSESLLEELGATSPAQTRGAFLLQSLTPVLFPLTVLISYRFFTMHTLRNCKFGTLTTKCIPIASDKSLNRRWQISGYLGTYRSGSLTLQTFFAAFHSIKDFVSVSSILLNCCVCDLCTSNFYNSPTISSDE